MESTINKYAFVDALRGWAILGVILFHTGMFWTKPAQPVVAQIAGAGNLGVQLFLVISAFSLFLSMDSRRSQEASPVKNFFIRRFFRIAPLYYLAIGIYLSISGLGPSGWAPNGIHWWYLPANFLFLHAWVPEAINSVVPGGWTIAVEAAFYSLLPLLYARLKNIRSTILFVALCLAAAKFLSDLAGYFLMPFYLQYASFVSMYTSVWFFSQAPIFGFGILIFHLFKKYRHHRSLKTGTVLLLLSLALVFSPFPFLSDVLPWQLRVGSAFCLLVMSLSLHPNRIIVNGATQWLGKLSYSLYLVHLLVMNALDQYFGTSILISGRYGFYVVLGITLVFSTAVAAATYWAVEVPGMRLGRLIIRKLEGSPAGTAVAGAQL